MWNGVRSISAEDEETMSQGNLLQGYNWETEYDDAQIQFSRPVPDEVISVYEVYVKEETEVPGTKIESTIVPNITTTNDQQLIQGDCIDLENAISSDVISVDGAVTKLLGKDALKYKILEHQNVNTDENILMYSQPVAEASSSTSTRLIDKDDPRSRLHFVKYLKRDGKTLKIWECGICSKEFRHQYTLMRHLPTHTDERNFKCEACGKAFRQLSTLSQHKAIHSDARPYVCEFCKKTFNRVSTLISHRKTHSEHKPHKCHLCGKGFHQKGNLRNHVFTHTNERPYKCELCGKGFNQMSNLVCHKVKAHAHAEKGQYTCGICGKEFPRRFSLRSHEEYKHGIKYRQSTTFHSDVNDQDIIKNKNVRVVHMSSDNCDSMSETKDKNLLLTPDYLDGIVIDTIETKAMEYALLQRQTPFALFKPAKGMPVLVKVSPSVGQKHILTPATAEDLRMAGKMGLSPTLTADADGNKAVQLKVPVVATVIQKVEPDGKFSFIIEAPAPENEQDENFMTSLDAPFTFAEPIRSESERQHDPVTSSATDDCNELLELAAQGGIQFVRATEDGRYEVMSNNEARELMAQNSHDMTILDGEEADAINVVNIRNNGDVIIGDSDNQIMVLDSSSAQKSIPMDGVEILDDRDIRILDGKGFDDRFADGITFLPQTKMEDFILGSKTLGMDSGVTIIEHDDEGTVTVNGQQELVNILSQRSDLSNMSTISQTSMSSLLNKSQSMSLLNDTLSYMKSSQNLADELGILSGSPMIDHQADYDTKIKLPVFDDHDTDAALIPISHSEVKILGPKTQDAKLPDNKSTLSPTKGFSGMNEIKILGPKNHSQELLSSQYQDMKLLNQYEQFLKNSSSHLTGYSFDIPVITKKEVKILGKKLETGIISTTEDGDIVEVMGEKAKSVGDGTKDFCCNTDTIVTSSPRLDRHTLEHSGPDSFLLQACSPCDPDFLSFDHRFSEKDTFPANHFERVQKECRDSFTSSGLPDLD